MTHFYPITKSYKAQLSRQGYVTWGFPLIILVGLLLRMFLPVWVAWAISLTLTVVLLFWIDARVAKNEAKRPVKKASTQRMPVSALYFYSVLYGAPVVVCSALVARHSIRKSWHMILLGLMAVIQLVHVGMVVLETLH